MPVRGEVSTANPLIVQDGSRRASYLWRRGGQRRSLSERVAGRGVGGDVIRECASKRSIRHRVGKASAMPFHSDWEIRWVKPRLSTRRLAAARTSCRLSDCRPPRTVSFTAAANVVAPSAKRRRMRS